MLAYNPKRRYSAVVMFSDDLEQVLLIHKLKPDWQAGKVNFPGGKVEIKDWPPHGTGEDENPDYLGAADDAYKCAAVRELHEETGLDVAAADLKLFCRLRFTSREGDEAECCFFTARGSVFDAETKETEQVFVEEYYNIAFNDVGYWTGPNEYQSVPPLPELPWLVSMAKEMLETNCAPRTVYQ